MEDARYEHERAVEELQVALNAEHRKAERFKQEMVSNCKLSIQTSSKAYALFPLERSRVGNE